MEEALNELYEAAALAAKIKSITADVLARHIGRQDVVKATFLALTTGRPAFFLGTPGVDKTGTVEALALRINGCYFFEALMPTVVSAEQLLVESTSIEELPVAGGGKSIRTRDTLGRAANAHLVFADEIWKADPRVLQTLIDLSKGDGVRHEGRMVKTPLLAFLAASNELPDPDGQLGAMWSRMTLRIIVNPLDKAGKTTLAKARLNRTASPPTIPVKLQLAEIETLREARKQVTVPDAIIWTVLEIYEKLQEKEGFSWIWSDDRRFGRTFDVLQANALLDGRMVVSKSDLVVLEWMLWDQPEQITEVRNVLKAYCRTPLMDAQEQLDALLAPGGTVAEVLAGNRAKGVVALTQAEEACQALIAHRSGCGDDTMMISEITKLVDKVSGVKREIIAVITGAQRVTP